MVVFTFFNMSSLVIFFINYKTGFILINKWEFTDLWLYAFFLGGVGLGLFHFFFRYKHRTKFKSKDNTYTIAGAIDTRWDFLRSKISLFLRHMNEIKAIGIIMN